MADPTQIKLFEVERLCRPNIDTAQLTLTSDVDRSETVYTQKYVKLANASLPGGVIVDEAGGELFDWDLFLILKYEQKWTPAGYGLGELLYTVSLMPDEELTLELKTWETSKTQQDREESVEQRNVSDIKDTTTSSSEVSETGEKTTNTSLNGKAGYSGFGFSASIEAGWSENVKETQAEHAKETRDRSQQATSEYKASHKVKIAVSRESGSESKTTRKLRNINKAHTLNANYYEVLTRYAVTLSLTKVPLAILGPEADLVSEVLLGDERLVLMPGVMAMLPEGQRPKFQVPPFRFGDLELSSAEPLTPSPGEPPPVAPASSLTLGKLIRYSQSSSWVNAFVNENGFSPIKLLHELWSKQLYLGAVPAADAATSPITDLARTAFRDGVLRFVRPIDGWVASDEKGQIRWGYEVIAGKEADLLEFLYARLPSSPSELASRIAGSGVDRATALDIAAHRFAEASEPAQPARPVRLARPRPARRAAPRMDVPEIASDRIASAGPFKGITTAAFAGAVTDFVRDVGAKLAEVRDVTNPVQSWSATIPTQGVYADLTLGICSGAEDYLEIQRQFDLETRKLEIEKLRCEIEKMKLENLRLQSGEPALVIQSDAAKTSLNLSFGEPASSVKIQEPGL
ncbi:MAG TPA: hypothetical protein VER12_14575 [Polyangiaceae bacterium]|nr:hypothetical protein [Polyangiaceae bacterium]